MMNGRFLKLVCLLAFSGTASLQAGTEVTVDINGTTYEFSESPKLTDLLRHIAEPAQVYWPAAALYESDPAVLKLRQNVLHSLSIRAQLLRQQKQPMQADELEKFITWLAQQRFARHVQLSVDYERSRHVNAYNPTLYSGFFYLSAKPATAEIALLGAAKQASAAIALADTIELADLYDNYALNSADMSWLFWRAGANQWNKSGIAYWNSTAEQIGAGAEVYLPFSSAVLGEDADLLNQQVLELLNSRVR